MTLKHSRVRRLLALACLATLAFAGLHAQPFTGSHQINLDARGFARYDIWVACEVTGSPMSYAHANARYGNVFGSSTTSQGKAGVILFFTNIRKVSGQWVAQSVTIQEINSSSGTYQNRYLSNHTVPNSDWVSGYGYCGSISAILQGNVSGSGAVNSPPVPAVSVAGRPHTTMVGRHTTITATFSATDPNADLSGIRYNIRQPNGSVDNNNGVFLAASGSSGAQTRTLTLSTAGSWYFWTDARDLTGLAASTPSGTNGYRIEVTPWCPPAYEPGYWNNDGYVRGWNNCYNYANNKRTDTFAQPGRGSGYNVTAIDSFQLTYGAISDGLEYASASATSPYGKTKVALVIWPGTDYHWYRLDSNGRWSHKIGTSSATNLDHAGQPITDPQYADRGPYTQFVGYFFTPADCTQGVGYANIQ